MSNDWAWADEILQQYQAEFKPEATQFVRTDGMADGEYGVEIVKCELTQLTSTGEPIHRITMKIIDGPGNHGCLTEKTTFFRNSVGINILGAELKLLGVQVDEWKTKNIGLAQGFSESGPTLKGVHATVRKRSSTAKDGKVYHNINFISLRARPVELGDAAEPDDNPFG
jgi:hypothetical protein